MVNARLNGKQIVTEGNIATCGHPALSIQSPTTPTLNGLPIILTTSDKVGDGVILPGGEHTVTINTLIVAVDNDPVTNHGDSPHNNAHIRAF